MKNCYQHRVGALPKEVAELKRKQKILRKRKQDRLTAFEQMQEIRATEALYFNLNLHEEKAW